MSGDEDGDLCPYCGQEYDHIYKEDKHRRPEYRDDAHLCKSPWVTSKRTVYVHMEPTVQISKVEKPQQSDRRGLIREMFT